MTSRQAVTGIRARAPASSSSISPEGSGAAFIFRAKSAYRIKILIWDGSGLILIYKRLDDAKFRWPRIEDGVMRLSPAQASALFEGLDWARVRAVRRARPQAVQ